jgi:hypothetical protein
MRDSGGAVYGNTATLDVQHPNDVELFEIEDIDPLQAFKDMELRDE